MPVQTHPAAASPTRSLTSADICAILTELVALPAIWFDADLARGEDGIFKHMLITQIGGPSFAQASTVDRYADVYTLRCLTHEGDEMTIAKADSAAEAIWALWTAVSHKLKTWGLRTI